MEPERRWSLRRQATALLGLLVLAALLGLLGISLYRKDTKSAAELAEVVGAVLAIFALVPPLARRLRKVNYRTAPMITDIDTARLNLAGIVEEQWRFEASI